jgi:hypothetical protein
VACALVATVGMVRARRADRAGDLTTAATVVGLTSLLIAPVSWMHAGMWLIPAIGVLVHDGRGRRRVLLGATAVILLSLLTPHPPNPTSGPIAVRVWHECLVALYVVLVVALPIRGRQPTGEPARPKDGPELRPDHDIAQEPVGQRARETP